MMSLTQILGGLVRYHDSRGVNQTVLPDADAAAVTREEPIKSQRCLSLSSEHRLTLVFEKNTTCVLFVGRLNILGHFFKPKEKHWTYLRTNAALNTFLILIKTLNFELKFKIDMNF